MITRKHDTIFIINPNANLGQAWRMAADLRPIIEENGGADWAGSVYPTHTTELTRQAVEQGYSLIIAGGGDGTVHEVVNGLMEYPPEKRPRIAVVPLGSGNDFAYSVGISSTPWKALQQIFKGEAKPIDVGKIEDDRGRQEFWVNTVGIGFDAIVTIYSHQLPVVRGFLMYFAAVMKTIFLNHDPITMKISLDDNSTWEDQILMLTLCNGSREGGGFKISPRSKNDDGELDYIAVRRISRLMMLRLIPEFMRGTHLRFSAVDTGKFHRLEILADRPLYIHLDGEIFAGFSSDLRAVKAEIIPAAVQIVS